MTANHKTRPGILKVTDPDIRHMIGRDGHHDNHMSKIWDSLFENKVPAHDPDRNVNQDSLCLTVTTSPPGLTAGQCAVGDTRHAYGLAHNYL